MCLDIVSLFQECAADIKDRMLTNKLKLNDDKTEVICPLHLPAPTSVSTGSSAISFTDLIWSISYWFWTEQEETHQNMSQNWSGT